MVQSNMNYIFFIINNGKNTWQLFYNRAVLFRAQGKSVPWTAPVTLWLV